MQRAVVYTLHAATSAAAANNTCPLPHSIVCLRSVPRNNKAWPLGLLLCPTRELALQLAAQAAQLVAGSQLTVKCVTGGTPLAQQVTRASVCETLPFLLSKGEQGQLLAFHHGFGVQHGTHASSSTAQHSVPATGDIQQQSMLPHCFPHLLPMHVGAGCASWC